MKGRKQLRKALGILIAAVLLFETVHMETLVACAQTTIFGEEREAGIRYREDEAAAGDSAQAASSGIGESETLSDGAVEDTGESIAAEDGAVEDTAAADISASSLSSSAYIKSGTEDTAAEEAEIIGEVISGRGIYTKEYLLSDHSHELVYYAEPVHYEDDDGNFIEIDNTLTSTEEGYLSEQNGRTILIPTQDGKKGRVEYSRDGKRIAWEMLSGEEPDEATDTSFAPKIIFEKSSGGGGSRDRDPAYGVSLR